MFHPARPGRLVATLFWGATWFAAAGFSARAQAPGVMIFSAGTSAPSASAPAPASGPTLPPATSSAPAPRTGQTPQVPPTPAAPTTTAPSTAATTPDFGAGAQAGEFGGGETALAGTPNFTGDFLGLPVRQAAPGTGTGSGGVAPGANRFSAHAPAFVTRTFKIGEDENPRPQDRVFVDFNYYDDVSHEFNDRFHTGFNDIAVYRETFGVEKTFFDGAASIELRLPLNSAHVHDTNAEPDPSNTDIGDLTTVLKWAPWIDPASGTVASFGLAVTAPTGPDHFANSPIFPAIHDTILTPFVGGTWQSDRFYTQVFLSIDVPTDPNDVTIWHTDLHFGYFLLKQTDRCAFLQGLVPVFEVHINDPLNHRGVFDLTDPVASDDSVNLTSGMHFIFRGGSSLAAAVCVPVTGPKPFEIEALVQFDYRFGPSARNPAVGGIGY